MPLLVLLLLSGCSDYGLGSGPGVVAPPIQVTPVATLHPWWETPWGVPPDGILPSGDGNPQTPDGQDLPGAARMTGGGVADGESHGFTLHCAFTHFSNHLEVTSDQGDFHLEGVDWVDCLDDPAIDPGQPSVGFDTVVGVGWGRMDGEPANVWFSFDDAGEPGTLDHADLEIDGATGMLSFSGWLQDGDQQAHTAL